MEHDDAGYIPRSRRADGLSPTAEQIGTVGRIGLDEPGVPRQGPRTVARLLTPHEQSELEIVRARQSERDAAMFSNDPPLESFIGMVTSTVRPLIVAPLAIMAVLFILFATTQLLDIFAKLAILPAAVQLVGYSALACLALVVGICGWRMFAVCIRLRQNRQVAIGQFKALAQRRNLRSQINQDRAAAVRAVESYLDEYPTDDSHQRMLGRCGLGLDDMRGLFESKAALGRSEDRANIDSWFRDVADHFQGRLDVAAEQVIQRYARRVGVKTAISPNSLVDSAIVIYCALGMLRELCQIYNLRLNCFGTLRLFGWVIAQAYVAGKTEDLTDAGGEWLQEWANEALSGAGLIGAEGASKILGGLGSRVADGYANAYLLTRLGRHAKGLLQPVQIS